MFDWDITNRKLCIFIPNYGRGKYLATTLKYLTNTKVPRDQWIIVIGNDGIHADEYMRDIDKFNAVYFDLDRPDGSLDSRNGCFARNYCIKRCQSELFMQIDPEIAVCGGVIDNIMKFNFTNSYYRPGWWGKLNPELSAKVLSGVLTIGKLHAPTNLSKLRQQFFHSGSTIKTDVLKRLGGYDERFKTIGWEDHDLQTRLEKIGINPKFDNNVYSVHLYHDPDPGQGTLGNQTRWMLNALTTDDPYRANRQWGENGVVISENDYDTFWEATRRKLCIFIPNYGRGKYLNTTLRYLANTTIPRDQWIVVVGNDGIVDSHHMPGIAQFNAISFVLTRKDNSLGPRNGGFIRNYCIKRCKSDLFLQMDPELILMGDIIKCTIGHNYTNSFYRPGGWGTFDKAQTTACLSGRNTPTRSAVKYDFVGNRSLQSSGGFHFGSCVKTSVLNELRGYDERFNVYGYEDHDMYRRLVKCGLAPFYDKNTYAVHLWHPTEAALDEKSKMMGAIFTSAASEGPVRNPNGWGEAEGSTESISREPRVGILTLATNRYIDYIPALAESISKYVKFDWTLLVLTDKELTETDKIRKLRTTHEQWPHITCNRYKKALEHSDVLRQYDYIWQIDSDMRFVGDIDKSILSDLTVVKHSGYYNKRRNELPFETNRRSFANTPTHIGTAYYAGAFVLGTSDNWIKTATTLADGICIDLSKNVMPVWHDESHLNAYLARNVPELVLPPDYCWPDNIAPPNDIKPKLLALSKNHEAMRK